MKLPSVLVQLAWALQPPLFVAHSSISTPSQSVTSDDSNKATLQNSNSRSNFDAFLISRLCWRLALCTTSKGSNLTRNWIVSQTPKLTSSSDHICKMHKERTIANAWHTVYRKHEGMNLAHFTGLHSTPFWIEFESFCQRSSSMLIVRVEWDVKPYTLTLTHKFNCQTIYLSMLLSMSRVGL